MRGRAELEVMDENEERRFHAVDESDDEKL